MAHGISNISGAAKLWFRLLPPFPFNFELLLNLMNLQVVRRNEGVNGGEGEVNKALNDERRLPVVHLKDYVCQRVTKDYA